MSAPSLKRGWCPGVLCPMESGDGLLARIRPRLGRIARHDAFLIADCAARFGNGAIDLSARGNIQLRGVSEITLPGLTKALDEAGLLDGSEAMEAARNIVVSPASDCDPEALIDAAALAARIEPIIADVARQGGLAPKFSLVIDDGGAFSLEEVAADIRLKPVLHDGKINLLLALAGDAGSAIKVGVFPCEEAIANVGALYRAVVRLFSGQRPKKRDEIGHWASAAGLTVNEGSGRPSPLPGMKRELAEVYVLRPAFGRLEASQLAEAAECLEPGGQASLRPTTQRALLIAPVLPPEKKQTRRIGAARGFQDRST